jgi:hypothetical protein
MLTPHGGLEDQLVEIVHLHGWIPVEVELDHPLESGTLGEVSSGHCPCQAEPDSSGQQSCTTGEERAPRHSLSGQRPVR